MTKGLKPIISINCILGGLTEILLQVFSVWVHGDNP